MRFFTALLVAASAALASAFTQPDYSKPPQGNSILTPGLQQQVPVGKPFEITWNPTTKGPVTLVLLRGPSNNVKPLYAIAEKIPNNGKYSWTPSTSLENDVTHYGILLVDDKTRSYQYSTQFGIQNPNPPSSESSSTTATETASSASSTSSGTSSSPASTTTVGSHTPTSTPITHHSKSASTSTVTRVSTSKISSAVASTTETPAAPTTLITTLTSTALPGSPPPPSTPPSPLATGSAGHNVAHMGGVGVAAGLIALLAF